MFDIQRVCIENTEQNGFERALLHSRDLHSVVYGWWENKYGMRPIGDINLSHCECIYITNFSYIIYNSSFGEYLIVLGMSGLLLVKSIIESCIL